MCAGIQNCLCGYESKKQSELVEAILADTSPPPSYLQCILLDCSGGPKKRVQGGIQDVPEISNLAGLLHQNSGNRGEDAHSTNGTLLTLKWADYDKDTRTASLQVHGGYGKSASTGYWSLLDNQKWRLLGAVSRCCNYSYFFHFSEDYQRADIKMKVNLGCICCKPWAPIPEMIIGKFNMEQYPDSENGSHWKRSTAPPGGGPFTFSYSLEAAYKPDGTPTKFLENLEKNAPKSMLLTR